MAISFVGAAAGDGTTITIPAGHQIGDLIIIYAFRGALTAPTVGAGFTNFNSTSGGASAYRTGYKIATSGAETSGTWTNAAGLICQVFRGVATNKTPIANPHDTTNTNSSVIYGTGILSEPGTSWLAAFAAIKTTDSALETPPTNMVNKVSAVGIAIEYAGHNTNGPYTAGQGAWPATTVAVGGTPAEWRAQQLEIFAEQGLPANYQFVKVGDGMSVGEKIR